MKRLPRNTDRQHRAGRRPADDPFDYWLDLVVELIIQPFFDLLRFAWRMIRANWPKSRSGREKCQPGRGRRRSRRGGRT